MNPQAYILETNGILDSVREEIYNVLKANKGITLSSNIILHLLPLELKNDIDKIASSYTDGACRKSGSYVGSVASMISNDIPNIGHLYSHPCPILRRNDDAFIYYM